MPRVTTHLRVGVILLSLLLLTSAPLASAATAPPTFTLTATPELIFTEVQVTAGTLSQEFIEIYNLTDQDIDLGDALHGGKNPWKLQFFGATATSTGKPDWTKPTATVSLTGTVAARSYFMVSATGYAPGGIDGDQAYNPRMSEDGGGLQLVTMSLGATVAHDRLLWKSAGGGQSLPVDVYPTPARYGSLQRLPTDEDLYENADGTLTEFISTNDISPKDIWQPVAPVETPPVEPDTPPAEDEEEPVIVVPPEAAENTPDLLAPFITELLPNPAVPQKDETDEFIELYNPNETAFNLKGYTLEVGASTLHDFTFTEDFMIPGLSYMAFYSRDTHLALTNTGGQARLLDTAGAVLSESQPYATADEGASWVFEAGAWQWSTTPTPAALNTVTLPAAKPKAVTTKAAAVKAPKKATAKTAAAKVKGASTTKAKAAKAKKAPKPKVAAVAQTTEKPARGPIHHGILVGVVAIALLYAAYEYRSDLQNRIYKLRHHRAVRFFARKQT